MSDLFPRRSITLRIQPIGDTRRWWIVVFLVSIVAGGVFIIFAPWNIGNLSSQPRPAHSYAEAVQRIDKLRDQETQDMNPVCRLQFMSHGQQVERVIVLVHGYTNCPEQFHQLSQRFYDLGYNVLIAPLPHHGLADRLTEEQAQLKAEELATYADKVVDIAQGLGQQVMMVGISGGAVTTAWAAQKRNDLDLAVIISPAFGYQEVKTILTAPGTNLYRILPNSFRWWDEALRAERGPEHCYPRYSTRALAEILRLGFAVQAAARRGPPAAQSILIVTNANDTAVNPELTARVVKDWREHDANLETYEFEAELGLPHDLIDPAQPDGQIEVVYPRLINLITR
jgi:alpha-beta hydrolase superfamily lysophospholipase